MLVTKGNIREVFDRINASEFLAVDTETTGLRLHQSDRLFSVVVASGSECFYFNFKPYEGLDSDCVLDRSILREFNYLSPRTIAKANAKCDMHALYKEGVDLMPHKLWDVLTVAKCLENKHMSYSLDNVAKREGFEKLSTVEEYIAKHKLFTIEQSPGKKTKSKNPHYDMVPLSLIQEYAERDARITYDIFLRQFVAVEEEHKRSIAKGYPSFWSVIDTEMETTKVCFEIEQRGMKIDEQFIKSAIEHESRNADHAAQTFQTITGLAFVDSNKALNEAFTRLGVSGGRTKKGNPSFTDKVLAGLHSPVAETVRDYRDATKRANTYFKSFLSFADENKIIHPSIRQAGADTFRFSITEPALQTLQAKDSSVFRVRDAFIARDGFSLVSIDYAQQEYRLAADYAGEAALIEKILRGYDVHEATAELMGLPLDKPNFDRSRGLAKTLNFMLLYGGGVPKLCCSLFAPKLTLEVLQQVMRKYVWHCHVKTPKLLEGLSQEDLDHDIPLLKQAQEIQNKYFAALPNIERLIDRVQGAAKSNRRIYNWAGRKLDFHPFWINNEDDADAPRVLIDASYKAPNYLIQSSGAEIMRRAMIEVRNFLKPYRSRILLSIHDELLFEMPEDEFHLIPEIRRLMVSVYKPFNGLYMDTSVAWGKSWGSLQEGIPDGTKTRDTISA